MRSHHPAKQSGARSRDVRFNGFQESAGFLQALVAKLGTSAVGYLIAQDGAQARLFKRLADQAERSRYVAGRRMMIEQAGSARARRFQRSGKRAPVNGLFVKCAVQAPPDQL